MATSASRWLLGVLLLAGVAAAVSLGIRAGATGRPATETTFPSPPTLANGVTVGCTDRHLSSGEMGPLEDGKQLHYVCADGKITRWWVDDSSAMETAPPG